MATAPVRSLRIPPHNLDSEKALLGALMLKPDSLHDISDLVSPESFYAEKHRMIMVAIMELFSKSEGIDLLTVSSKLRDQKRLEQIGGGSYLSELMNTVPAAANAKFYAEMVQKTALLRGVIAAAEDIGEMGYDQNTAVDEILDRAEKRMYQVAHATSTRKFIALRDGLDDAWNRLDALHNANGATRGVPTGYKDLDNLLSGFQPSDLIILAARPSIGKTSFALDIARQAATMHNVPVGIFSLEMSSQQLVDRLLSAEARVDAWKLRTGKLSTDQEFEQIRGALDRLASAPIYIDDQPSASILTMRSVARRLMREHGLGLIIIDYLQLMVPTNSRATDNLVQQVTEISRSLKGMARELNVPVLALSQLSRAVEARGGKPRLSDLRDSGSIEQDADVVMFIHRDDKINPNSDQPNIAEIMIEKHRNGPTGSVKLFFDSAKTSFLPIEKSDFGSFETAVADDF